MRRCSKKSHAERERAEAHKLELLQKGDDPYPKALRTYWCGYCRAWHVGHSSNLGKGKAAWKQRRKARKQVVSDAPKEGRTCEVSEYAKGVESWEEVKRCWEGHPLAGHVECHHPFHERWHDAPWNNLYVCHPFNTTFVEDVWPKAGFVISVYALWKLERFDYAAAEKALRRPPLGKMENWLRAGELDSSPIVATYARELLRGNGLWGPPATGCVEDVTT
jgi:ribosomal protein L44E